MTEVLAEQVKELQSKGEKVLVQYTASWCGPCKALTPRLSNISNSYPNVTFLKVDVDKNMNEAVSLEIRSVPTVIIYEGNEVVNRSTGVQPDSFYKEILDNL